MEIVIQSNEIELTSRARLAIKSRVEVVLHRLVQYVNRVSVNFEDVNGPKGGIDKQCKVKLSLNTMSPVVVVAQEDNPQTAFTIAFARALAALKKRLKRVQQMSRRPRIKKMLGLPPLPDLENEKEIEVEEKSP